MSSKDPAEEPEYSPRPNDFLVEPMFAPLEKKPTEAEPDEQLPRSVFARVLGWLRGAS